MDIITEAEAEGRTAGDCLETAPAELELRLRRLEERIAFTRERLTAQELALERLRAGIADYGALAADLAPSSEPEPTFDVQLPSLDLDVAEDLDGITADQLEAGASEQLPGAGRWKVPAVSAALAGLVLAAGMAAPWRPAVARPAVRMTHLPLPETAAVDPQSLADESVNNEVLGLVYAYVPPGSNRSVQEMLGPNPHSSADDSPWVFVNVDARTTLVSFRPYGDDPDAEAAYEFVVDRLARTVTASADTLLNMGTLAALRSL